MAAVVKDFRVSLSTSLFTTLSTGLGISWASQRQRAKEIRRLHAGQIQDNSVLAAESIASFARMVIPLRKVVSAGPNETGFVGYF